MMNSKKRKRTGFLLILPLLILFLGLTIYPLIYMIYMSFHQYSLASWEEPRFIGWENYREILRDRTASSSVSFTLFLLFTAVPLEILLGIGIAFLIRDVWGERALRSSLIIPMTIPPVVAGIAWKMLYNYEFGPINYFLSLFGLPKVSWLGSQFFARLGVLLIDVWQWTPFIFLVIYAGLQSIPRDVVEASLVDGASGWSAMRYIELPLLRPLIWVTLIIRVIDVLKLFDIVYMVTFGGPGSATHSYSFYIYKVGISFGWDVGYASALSVILLLVVTVLTNLLIRFLRLSETLGL
ncbi:carbohydrate ABC transporter permease [Candidatus Sordicultor fermentans]|jgi:multiple sugar transport system permease protein|uniref:carbohydrate ABC transporter permease n=1 Tax=Candidatus Sordicultor fermentans TaxID=1953203 RepID=UPI0016AB2DBF|nr:sugar ABC transporter permease [Atribacterota bacterium]NLY04831.1 sugar ABC transporter permease [Candidatus Atribacteria bacterium]MDI9608300.1 sugar ABC transporter permease [Atribacterota bacterium]MDY0134640.1 sugar ABC transporter permease [Atribacterota bacterium]HOA98482.1 sugar ABC transporter permease [Candidatus Atribacteria bacterium]